MGHSLVMVIVHVVLQREPVVRLSWLVAVFTLPAGSWGETSNGSQLIFTPLAKIFFCTSQNNFLTCQNNFCTSQNNFRSTPQNNFPTCQNNFCTCQKDFAPPL